MYHKSVITLDAVLSTRLVLVIIGFDSTEAVGKMPGTCSTTGAKCYFCPRVLFCPARPGSILTLLSFTKMVKIATVRSVFATKIHLDGAFASGTRNPPGELPQLLVSWGGKHVPHPFSPRRLQRLKVQNSQHLWLFESWRLEPLACSPVLNIMTNKGADF